MSHDSPNLPRIMIWFNRFQPGFVSGWNRHDSRFHLVILPISKCKVFYKAKKYTKPYVKPHRWSCLTTVKEAPPKFTIKNKLLSWRSFIFSCSLKFSKGVGDAYKEKVYFLFFKMKTSKQNKIGLLIDEEKVCFGFKKLILDQFHLRLTFTH